MSRTDGVRSLRDISKESLELILRSHYRRKDIKITEESNSELKQFEGSNDFYNSQIRKLSVKIKIGDDEDTLHMVVKTPPTGFIRFMQRMMRPLLKETVWYKLALPTLAAKFPILEKITPKCYHAYARGMDDLSGGCWERACCSMCYTPCRRYEKGLIILEDLTRAETPFYLADKNRVMSPDHVRLALEALAHFHGAWWQMLQGKEEGTFDGPMTRADVQQFYGEKPVKIFSLSLSKNKKILAKLAENKNLTGLSEKLRRYDTKKATRTWFGGSSKMETVVHGDFWSNNMMFSNDKDGKPTGVKILDYQMGVISQPIGDICYFLYINTDKDFRRSHMNDCLKWYFDVFSSYSTTIEFSFEDFMAEFDKFRDVGMLLGVMVLSNVLCPSKREVETFSDFKRMFEEIEETLLATDSDDDHPMVREIRRRTIEAVEEMDELGLI